MCRFILASLDVTIFVFCKRQLVVVLLPDRCYYVQVEPSSLPGATQCADAAQPSLSGLAAARSVLEVEPAKLTRKRRRSADDADCQVRPTQHHPGQAPQLLHLAPAPGHAAGQEGQAAAPATPGQGSAAVTACGAVSAGRSAACASAKAAERHSGQPERDTPASQAGGQSDAWACSKRSRDAALLRSSFWPASLDDWSLSPAPGAAGAHELVADTVCASAEAKPHARCCGLSRVAATVLPPQERAGAALFSMPWCLKDEFEDVQEAPNMAVAHLPDQALQASGLMADASTPVHAQCCPAVSAGVRAMQAMRFGAGQCPCPDAELSPLHAQLAQPHAGAPLTSPICQSRSWAGLRACMMPPQTHVPAGLCDDTQRVPCTEGESSAPAAVSPHLPTRMSARADALIVVPAAVRTCVRSSIAADATDGAQQLPECAAALPAGSLASLFQQQRALSQLASALAQSAEYSALPLVSPSLTPSQERAAAMRDRALRRSLASQSIAARDSADRSPTAGAPLAGDLRDTLAPQQCNGDQAAACAGGSPSAIMHPGDVAAGAKGAGSAPQGHIDASPEWLPHAASHCTSLSEADLTAVSNEEDGAAPGASALLAALRNHATQSAAREALAGPQGTDAGSALSACLHRSAPDISAHADATAAVPVSGALRHALQSMRRQAQAQSAEGAASAQPLPAFDQAELPESMLAGDPAIAAAAAAEVPCAPVAGSDPGTRAGPGDTQAMGACMQEQQDVGTANGVEAGQAQAMHTAAPSPHVCDAVRPQQMFGNCAQRCSPLASPHRQEHQCSQQATQLALQPSLGADKHSADVGAVTAADVPSQAGSPAAPGAVHAAQTRPLSAHTHAVCMAPPARQLHDGSEQAASHSKSKLQSQLSSPAAWSEAGLPATHPTEATSHVEDSHVQQTSGSGCGELLATQVADIVATLAESHEVLATQVLGSPYLEVVADAEQDCALTATQPNAETPESGSAPDNPGEPGGRSEAVLATQPAGLASRSRDVEASPDGSALAVPPADTPSPSSAPLGAKTPSAATQPSSQQAQSGMELQPVSPADLAQPEAATTQTQHASPPRLVTPQGHPCVSISEVRAVLQRDDAHTLHPDPGEGHSVLASHLQGTSVSAAAGRHSADVPKAAPSGDAQACVSGEHDRGCGHADAAAGGESQQPVHSPELGVLQTGWPEHQQSACGAALPPSLAPAASEAMDGPSANAQARAVATCTPCADAAPAELQGAAEVAAAGPPVLSSPAKGAQSVACKNTRSGSSSKVLRYLRRLGGASGSGKAGAPLMVAPPTVLDVRLQQFRACWSHPRERRA
jgi:hypothetical protein